MRYGEHLPCPALRSRIECYWSFEGDGSAPAHLVLPDGCCDLLFRFDGAGAPLRGGGFSAARVVGVMSRAHVSPAGGPLAFLGVRFRPGEARTLLGFSQSELRDQELELDQVWSRGADELVGRLTDARDVAARVRCLDEELLVRVARGWAADARVRRAVRALEASSGTLRIDALARGVGLGARQLERAFLEQVGLGPKALARVLRLRSVVRRLDAAPARIPLAALAADSGYADQAHFVHEVRALTGVTPKELVRLRAVTDSSNSAVDPATTLSAGA